MSEPDPTADAMREHTWQYRQGYLAGWEDARSGMVDEPQVPTMKTPMEIMEHFGVIEEVESLNVLAATLNSLDHTMAEILDTLRRKL